jgi:hypothetical protein
MVSLALLLRPSTTPLDSCFLARKEFRISARCERSVLAIFFKRGECLADILAGVALLG